METDTHQSVLFPYCHENRLENGDDCAINGIVSAQ
tara:strand:+ start:560 stop:664 length:105 start_codon:yes stop_codon:yes gene_type:complete